MQCIIFTDSKRLADKYRVCQQDVLNIISSNLLYRKEHDTFLLDAVYYKEELNLYNSWSGYKFILQDFIKGMGLEESPSLSLFILGGDDVIPMPRVPNPLGCEKSIQADFLYCFKEESIEEIDYNHAICNVGRLPMENGLMPRSLEDDLQSYFNLCSMFYTSYIEVNSVLMTSTQSWIPASNEMVRNLPIIKPKYVFGATKECMYISPELSIDNTAAITQYKKDLEDADMLVFNLHGTNIHRHASFYGEGINGHNTPEVFDIEKLKHSRARIFNTVACYGGRFIGYNRTESMLLSAIYGGGVLLYAGSCVSALGRSGKKHIAVNDILMPTGMSESFMKLYSLYLFSGVSAGEAFLKAKCDYFNTCRNIDSDECALATILMFNLFGMPYLYVRPQKNIITEACGIKHIRPVPSEKPVYKKVYVKEGGKYDLLGELRKKVNENLLRIHNIVRKQLYNYWEVESSDLYSVEEIYKTGVQDGFRFIYKDIKAEYIDKSIWIYTDINGKVQDVIHLK